MLLCQPSDLLREVAVAASHQSPMRGASQGKRPAPTAGLGQPQQPGEPQPYGRDAVGRVVRDASQPPRWEARVADFDAATGHHRLAFSPAAPPAAAPQDATVARPDEWAALASLRFVFAGDPASAADPNPSYDAAPKGADAVGRRLRIYWPGMGRWYAGTVRGYDAATGRHHVVYKDGDSLEHRLRHEAVRWVDQEQQQQHSVGVVAAPPVAANIPLAAVRREPAGFGLMVDGGDGRQTAVPLMPLLPPLCVPMPSDAEHFPSSIVTTAPGACGGSTTTSSTTCSKGAGGAESGSRALSAGALNVSSSSPNSAQAAEGSVPDGNNAASPGLSSAADDGTVIAMPGSHVRQPPRLVQQAAATAAAAASQPRDHHQQRPAGAGRSRADERGRGGHSSRPGRGRSSSREQVRTGGGLRSIGPVLLRHGSQMCRVHGLATGCVKAVVWTCSGVMPGLPRTRQRAATMHAYLSSIRCPPSAVRSVPL